MRRLAEFILVLACYVVVNGINEAVLTPRDVAHPEDILKRVSPVSKKDQLKIPRSITHGEGAGRKCEHEDDLKKWLPDLESPKPPEGGHYHLLLAVSDDQLAFLINWLAVGRTVICSPYFGPLRLRGEAQEFRRASSSCQMYPSPRAQYGGGDGDRDELATDIQRGWAPSCTWSVN